MTRKYQPAWEATWAGFAELLEADEARRKRRERADRARINLPDPPSARSHQERLEAARGLHVHGDGLRTPAADRRRIRKHREASDE